MAKLRFVCGFLVVMTFTTLSLVLASEVVLKSGQKIEGKIVEQTDKYVKIDPGVGIATKYYSDEIDTVDGQKLQVSASSVTKSSSEDITSYFTSTPLIWDEKSRQFSNDVADLLKNERFEQLEAIEANVHKARERRLSGGWKLASYYYGLNNVMESRDTCAELLKKWFYKNNKSSIPLIALAELYSNVGWSARGSSYAAEVPQQQWDDMQKYLKQAEDVLSKAEAMEYWDPYLYPVKIKIANGLGYPKGKINAIIEEGKNFEPTFYPLYEEEVIFLLPKWGGEPGEISRFADYVVEQTKATDANAGYAMIAMKVFKSDYHDYISNNFFSWPKLKQGFLDLQKRFPASLFNASMFCRMACQAGDKNTARQLFRIIGTSWEKDISEQIWQSPDAFQSWKKWAESDVSKPLDEDLFNAVFNGDTENVQRLLDKGSNINYRNRYGYTPIILAARSGLVDIVKLLIDHGADINQKASIEYTIGEPSEIQTPLIAAAMEKRIKVIDLLLAQKSIDVNASTDAGLTALHFSNQNGDNDSFQLLLKHGASLNPDDQLRPLNELERKLGSRVELSNLQGQFVATVKGYCSGSYVIMGGTSMNEEPLWPLAAYACILSEEDYNVNKRFISRKVNYKPQDVQPYLKKCSPTSLVPGNEQVAKELRNIKTLVEKNSVIKIIGSILRVEEHKVNGQPIQEDSDAAPICIADRFEVQH
jgi:hypothetical protein